MQFFPALLQISRVVTRFWCALVSVLIGAALQSAYAQIGNNNPTGPAGAFNGHITTGCSYDPVTGNAVRSITDLVVANGVGAYPLAFTRIANSRAAVSGKFQFGAPGRWKHSYTWSISGTEGSSTFSFSPTYYSVSFPDGRAVTFRSSSTDADPYFRGGPGIRERFQPLSLTTMLAFLLLPDGGKIEFKATRLSECDPELNPPCVYRYTYQAQAIIDPHGLRSTLTYNADGSLNTIEEPAGRWIQLVYVTTPWVNGSGSPDIVIDHIQASDGRQVRYNYGAAAFNPGTWSYTYLGNVVYYPDPSVPSPPTAVYTYRAPNIPTGTSYNGAPLLASCDDPLYAGPMDGLTPEKWT